MTFNNNNNYTVLKLKKHSELNIFFKCNIAIQMTGFTWFYTVKPQQHGITYIDLLVNLEVI